MNDDELVYRRVLRAPRELVWRCLTEPAELAQFWGPRGMTTPLTASSSSYAAAAGSRP